MPIQLTHGSLNDDSILAVMATAQLSRITGTLNLHRDQAVKNIFFRNGQVVGARSNQLSESLGRLLVAWGLISRDHYVASLERMDQGKEKHGQILVSMGALNEAAIPEALVRQHRTRLIDAASWSAGRYDFALGDVPGGDKPFDLWPVFQEALYRRYGKAGTEELARKQRNAVPRRTGGLLEAFILNIPDAAKAYDRIDSRKTVAELAPSGISPLVFFLQLLVLEELGLAAMRELTDEEQLERYFRRARELSPAELLGLAPGASPEDVSSAAGALKLRFPPERYVASRFYQPLIDLIDSATHVLARGVSDRSTPAGEFSPQAERAFQHGKDYLAKRQLPFAAQKFEEAIFFAPDAVELKGYFAWTRFLQAPRDEAALRHAEESLRVAVAADPDDADLQAFLGASLKLQGRLVESEAALLRALELAPEHAFARRELESLHMRKQHEQHHNLPVASIDADARIIVQRWIGGHTVVNNFYKDEVRVGSGPSDDLAVSADVLPQIVKTHCILSRKGTKLHVARTGSSGIVSVNGRALQVREEVEVASIDTITLGEPDAGPVLQLRVLDQGFLSRLQSVRQRSAGDFWVG